MAPAKTPSFALCRPISRRKLPAWCGAAVSIGLLLGVAAPLPALINPSFTPIHLMKESTAIVDLEAGVLTDGVLPVKILATRKGAAPAELKFVLGDDTQVKDDLDTGLGGAKSVKAIYFVGNFAKAAMDGGGTATTTQTGALLVGGKYLAVSQGPKGELVLSRDTLALRTIWAGNADMLLKLMDYIQQDRDASVPVASGASMTGDKSLPDVPGCTGLTPLELGEPAGISLLATSGQGDKLFSRLPDGTWEDRAKAMGLASKSLMSAAGDFDGDGKLDLASWDGKTVTLWLRQKEGGFAASAPVATECLSLSVIQDAKPGRAALIVAQSNGMMMLNGDGLTPVKKHRSMAPTGAATVADFDGDGYTDCVQVYGTGLLFYPGGKDGLGFPRPACDQKLTGEFSRFTLGDFDADGLLDIFACGAKGTVLLRNMGKGMFFEQVVDSGEIGYDDKLDALCAAAMDMNNDGRLDLVLGFSNKLPFFFFNRGFSTFGVANDMLFDSDKGAADGEKAKLNCTADIRDGVVALAAADFDGNGAQELAMASPTGKLWLLQLSPGTKQNIALTVGGPLTGGVEARAWDGARPLGARAILPGQPAFFGKGAKGALKIETNIRGEVKTESVFLQKPARREVGGQPAGRG